MLLADEPETRRPGGEFAGMLRLTFNRFLRLDSNGLAARPPSVKMSLSSLRSHPPRPNCRKVRFRKADIDLLTVSSNDLMAKLNARIDEKIFRNGLHS